MTARIGTTSIDGTPISETDRARIEAEESLHLEQQRGAARIVAASSVDLEDCRVLLEMLGLDRAVVAAARAQLAAANPAATAKRSRKRHAA